MFTYSIHTHYTVWLSLICLYTAYIYMLLYGYFTHMFTYSVHRHVTVCLLNEYFYIQRTNTCYCMVTFLICLNTAYIHVLLYGYFTNMSTYSVHTHVTVLLLYSYIYIKHFITLMSMDNFLRS